MTSPAPDAPGRSTRRHLVAAALVATVVATSCALAAHARADTGPPLSMPTGLRPPVALTGSPARPDDDAGDTDPALTGVDAELARRFLSARDAAAADGVTLTITSGKRSAQEQQELVDEAIARYGSLREAQRWVLPPDGSAHVVGLALDVGPTDGALWLGEHGLGFGLCRTYANEIWHFEKLPDGRTDCAPMHDDSSAGW